MIYLTAAVIFVGAVAVLDLLLTVGVVRRLREHGRRLSGLPAGIGAPDAAMAVGEPVGEFSAVTTDGVPLSRELLAGQALVGFFTPDCGPCHESVPAFTEAAAAFPGGRERVLAVVLGEGDGATAFAASLAGTSLVVVEPGVPGRGPVASAFSVQEYPAFGLVDDQVIATAGHSPKDLRVPASA